MFDDIAYQLFAGSELNASPQVPGDIFYTDHNTVGASFIAEPQPLVESVSTYQPTAADWFSSNILDLGLQEIVRSRGGDGILDRNDMLAIFTDSGLIDDIKIDATEQNDLKNLINNANLFATPEYVKFLSTRVVDGISTDMSVDIFNDSLLNPWFLGSVTPTASFNDINLTFQAVAGNLYDSSGTPQIENIDQSYFLGNCAFLSALGATFSPQFSPADTQSSSIIQSMIIDNGDNTYTIRFYDNLNPQWVTVDRRLPFNADTGEWFGALANDSTDPNNSANVLWAPLVERAYAQWREWREGSKGYDLIGNGEHLSLPLSFITGKSAVQYGEGGTAGSFSSVTFGDIQNALGNGKCIELGRYNPNDTTYIVGSHAYALTNAYINENGEQRIVVYNPWGVDGFNVQGDNDGFIDLSFIDFQSSFDSMAIA